MNKLQLYITINYKQYQQMLEINKDEHINKHVVNVSNALDCITYDEQNKEIFYLLKYTDKGVFLVILRTIPADTKSLLSAWIFIPAEVEITDIELEKVASTVVSIISKPSMKSDDVNVLQELFKKEYPTQSIFGATIANQGAGYAHRFYGGNSDYELLDFLGNMRYQTMYLPFAGLLLVDKNITNVVQGTDLTEEPLNQMVKVFPPKSSSTSYKPYIFGEVFDRPLLMPLMCTVEILWKSDTNIDKHQSIMISQANMRIDAPAEPTAAKTKSDDEDLLIDTNNDDTKTPVTPQAEKPEEVIELAAETEENLPTLIKSEPKEEVVEENDEINTEVIASQEPVKQEPVKQESVKQEIKPEIKAPIVTPQEPKPEPAPEPAVKTQKSVITEKPNGQPQINGPHVYKFELPAKSADISGMIKFTVTSRNVLKESPIDGYSCDGEIQEGNRVNYLKYSNLNQKQLKLLWGGRGLLVGILATLICVMIFSGGKSADSTEGAPNDTTLVAEPIAKVDSATTTTPAKSEEKITAQPAEPKDVSMAAAIAYLDTNKVWEKSEMEEYPDLRGLYNDMNTFNRDRLVSHWGQKLKESRKFASVVEHAKYGKKKKVRVPDGQKTFNVGKDTSIKVQNYLNTIDP